MKRNRYNLLFLILILILITSCASVSVEDEVTEISEKNMEEFVEPFKPSETITVLKPPTQSETITVLKPPTQSETVASTQILNPSPQVKQSFSQRTNPKYSILTQKQENLDDLLSSYRLGQGDVISIKVFGEEDFSVDTPLSKKGTISYPFLGELQLANLTVKQVENLIMSGLKGDYLKNPKIMVTILEYRQLFVNGEVKAPGGYAFKPGMTINKAISLAGGFTDNASREELFVIRDGDQTMTPLLATLKTYVGPGDTVLVREYKKFFVNGEVKAPGSYAYIPDLTVEKAISMAGGFGEFASARWGKIYIIRDDDKTETSIRANLKTPVYPGDIITVEESAF